jgi:ribonucleotide reductase alpha subunit
MSQIFVESGDLGGDLLNKLNEFLNTTSLKIQSTIDGNRIAITDRTTAARQTTGKTTARKAKKTTEKKKKKKVHKETHISKTKLKVYLKRFINKQGLSDDLRVISGGRDTFIFHAKPVYEVEPKPEEGA